MTQTKKLPVVFVRDLVVFPGMSIPLTVGREASRLAVLEAQKNFDNTFVTMTQLRAEDEEIKSLDGVYTVGTICRIEKVVALTDGGMQVQIEGRERFQGRSLEFQNGLAFVTGTPLPDEEPSSENETREVLESLSSYQPGDSYKIAWREPADSEELKRINARVAQRQNILEEPSAAERIRLLKALEQAKA